MLFNTKLLYTPTLSLNEFGPRALVIDFETIGSSDFSEPFGDTLGDHEGRIVFDSLIRPVFNALPSPSRLKRFDREELRQAPTWAEIWPKFSDLISGKTLIAFNASFDRRTLAAACARHRVTNPSGARWGNRTSKPGFAYSGRDESLALPYSSCRWCSLYLSCCWRSLY